METPEELKFLWNFKRYGHPRAGWGWLDWPIGLPRRAAIYENVYNAFSSRRRSEKKARWADSNPEMNDIFTKVVKLRKEVARRGD